MSVRTISWNAALRDLRDDRTKVPAGFAGSRALAQTFIKTRRLPLVVAGQYDRSAIMQVAILAAKAHQGRYGSTWGEALSVSLKATWQLAKAARAATRH
ncbi:hypothetical protein [Methylobacterium sp. CCH5-D2]|uniref:hypothetical protein n=1 Tax=Methylobacterium sp. CCH5-D2 TaxID=1768765 RepID=UPI0008314BE7|nr:hypothetical protein [Methylobacterium sp. CCH5-D2]